MFHLDWLPVVLLGFMLRFLIHHGNGTGEQNLMASEGAERAWDYS
jgi:hypothetical protein